MLCWQLALIAEVHPISRLLLLVLLLAALVNAALRHLINEAERIQDDVVLALRELANVHDVGDFLVLDGPNFALVR